MVESHNTQYFRVVNFEVGLQLNKSMITLIAINLSAARDTSSLMYSFVSGYFSIISSTQCIPLFISDSLFMLMDLRM